jgi:recombination protein RecT
MKSSKPEDILYVYAVAHLKGGGVQFEVMPKREVDAIRARSRSGNEGPWKTDYAEMAKKTVVRRLAKYLPLTIEGIRATEIDDSNDFGEGEAITIDVPVSADPFTEEGGEDVTE